MPAATTTGRRLGRYHLADPMGGGPCGAVYRAKVYGVAGFERQFAVKRFHPELVALPAVSQRLSSAARAYGSLEHPRIARLHEYGVAAGEVFTAVELVPGLDLMRLVAATHAVGEPLPPGAAIIVLAQVARAVGYAHGRGVNHLGLCPTNVIVTPDGDVKVTDFGMLAQTMTLRPSNDGRLVHRIPYLAPEQLVGESTSAATDVFALGAIAHELVTGERAFVGVSPLDVEQAILSGHVRDSGLPRALAKVLTRCFARSPFERFPDARALADAIDAALRIAPITGGRRELAVLVKEAVARLEQMNEAQLSGAMTLALPMPPQPMPVARRGAAPAGGEGKHTDAVTAIRDPLATAPAAAPPPSPARPSPSPSTAPATAPPAARPPMQIPPVPPVAPPPSTPRTTMMGAAAMPPRSHSPTRPPPIVPPVVTPRPVTRTAPPPITATAPPAGIPDVPSSVDDSEEHTLQRDPRAGRASVAPMAPSGPVPPAPARLPNASPLPFATPAPADLTPHGETSRLRLDTAWPEGGSIPDGSSPLDDGPLSSPRIEMFVDNDSEGVPVVPPVAVSAPVAPPAPLPLAEAVPLVAPPRASTPPARRGHGKLVVFFLACAALGVGGVFAWDRWLRGGAAAETGGDAAATAADPEVVKSAPPSGTRPATTPDAGRAVAVAPDAGAAAVAVAPAVDAGAVAVAPAVDAGAVAVAPAVDAGAVADPVDPDATAHGGWLIESTPPGARVYFDEAEQGVTPLRLPASPDRHTIALVLPGHALYTAQVDGRGVHRATLQPVTPLAGPAGIKVKCKAKGRYYVFVDGVPTGQLCPTERIGVEIGEHTVEVYDLVTEERKSFPARVKETRNSLRVKVDEASDED